MEEAGQGCAGLHSRSSPASASVEEGFLPRDLARTEASEDSPAPARGGWWFPWSRDDKNVASDRKHSAGNPPRPPLEKHLEQDEPGNRSCLTAGTARSWTKLESELQVLRSSTHPLALEFLQTLERPIQIIAQLLTENQQLQQNQQQDRSQNDRVAQLLAENQQLQQELQKLKSGQRASVPQRTSRFAVNWPRLSRNTAFPVQLWITGQTKGCEKQFMDDVTRLLADQEISLQVANYQENSEQFLLLFCPIASRSGTDINNALEGLSGMRKALLVVCHYKTKGNSQQFVSCGLEGRHPALVTTVHACYTLQDGFYPCQMNTEATAAVAAAIACELRGD